MADRGSIVFSNTAMWDHIATAFARQIKNVHGVDTVMLTHKALLPNRATFFDRTAFSEIIDWRPLLRIRPPHEVASTEFLAEEARRIERSEGFSLLEAIRSDRHVGAGFLAGATAFTSSYARGATFDQIVDLALRIHRAIVELLDRVRPIAVLSMAGMVHTTMLVNAAEARGIPVRFLGAPRRRNLFFWSDNRFAWPVGFDHKYRLALASAPSRISPHEAHEPADETQLHTAMAIRENRRRPGLSDLLGAIYGILRSNWRRIVGLQPDSDYGMYSIPSRLATAVWTWRMRRFIATAEHVLPRLPNDMPTVFFPLSSEPEMSLLVEAQCCDNQLTPIDWLAKALPAGWRLLIKEHPVMDMPRPRGFWEQVRRYPNVVVLATTENADDVMRRAKAVAVISSTVGVQAAMRGKPAISFNPNYIGTVMPHVLVATSYSATAEALRRVRDDDLPSPEERSRAVWAFRQALAQSEFPIDDAALKIGVPGKIDPDPALISTLADTFFRTLDSADRISAR